MPTPQNALAPRIDGEMRATPRNALLGLLADALSSVDQYANKPDRTMPMGKANPVLGLLSNALGVGDLAATANNLSYGHPLTQGTGWARQMYPETANALLAAAPVAAKFPKQAAAVTAGLLSGDTNAARAALVWHGSPHKFDKFDSSKIGTGEGAQAYGHGLYLAESPDVAKSYTTAGTGAATKQSHQYTDPILRAAATVEKAGGDVSFAIRRLSSDAERGDQVASQAIKHLESGGALPDIGLSNLYKVDLPDSAISRMLDWDKPLSQQPEVLAALNANVNQFVGMPQLTVDVASGRKVKSSLRADDFYNKLSGNADPLDALGPNPGKLKTVISATGQPGVIADNITGQAAASERLRRMGIPGIRYLDGGSRGAGAGTSNFVVFPGEENMLSILERNGVPLK